eukprot:868532-Rhodomonas_salina.1
MPLRVRYAMSGTDLRYHITHSAARFAVLTYGYPATRLLSNTCFLPLAISFSLGIMIPAIALRTRNAISGTDVAPATTRKTVRTLFAPSVHFEAHLLRQWGTISDCDHVIAVQIRRGRTAHATSTGCAGADLGVYGGTDTVLNETGEDNAIRCARVLAGGEGGRDGRTDGRTDGREEGGGRVRCFVVISDDASARDKAEAGTKTKTISVQLFVSRCGKRGTDNYRAMRLLGDAQYCPSVWCCLPTYLLGGVRLSDLGRVLQSAASVLHSGTVLPYPAAAAVRCPRMVLGLDHDVKVESLDDVTEGLQDAFTDWWLIRYLALPILYSV